MTRLLLNLSILAAALALFAWYSAHERSVGEQKIRDADAKALAIAVDRANIQTEVWRALAREAEHNYDLEHQKNLDLAARPVGVSQLCRPARNSLPSVATASGANPGDAGAGTPPAVGGGLPEADHGQPDDRKPLLGAFAALFDDTSARLRLWQERGK